jgi:hypothetical protein
MLCKVRFGKDTSDESEGSEVKMLSGPASPHFQEKGSYKDVCISLTRQAALWSYGPLLVLVLLCGHMY